MIDTDETTTHPPTETIELIPATDAGSQLRTWGARLIPEHGRWIDFEDRGSTIISGGCAVGTLYAAIVSGDIQAEFGNRRGYMMDSNAIDRIAASILNRYPALRQHVDCPVGCSPSDTWDHCALPDTYQETALAMMDHLFERHLWPIGQIADWLDRIPDVPDRTPIMPDLLVVTQEH